MNKKELYTFHLLREEAVDADLFEHKTHEHVAETLLGLIKNQKGGVTVGLEGSWGSGKSTVISIFKKLAGLDGNNTFVVQFDTWAHEGDPLRRIFLEHLLDELSREALLPNEKTKSGKDGFVTSLKKKISNRQRRVEVETSRSPSPLGFWFSVAMLFIPMGLLTSRIVSIIKGNDLSKMQVVLLLLSFICYFMPFGVLIFNIGWLKKNGLSIKNLKNWKFMDSTSSESIIKEVSEEEERSSIEFERYFSNITTALFKKNPKLKLILVLDNLDRIDPKDSLRIWSTLQTFLQKRNSPDNGDKYWFDHLWIVVPYDHDGLAKLWENKTVDNSSSDQGKSTSEPLVSNVSGSFFDKCFQIRLEVPKPLFSEWKAFAKEQIEKALISESEEEKKAIFDVLELTRNGLLDIPTPREIKVFVNQVGVLRSQFIGKGISSKSTAYYVVLRTLRRKSVKDIRDGIIEGKYPEEKLQSFFSEYCANELAGLLFGVPPKHGMQLLLEPEIENALHNGNSKDLSELEEKHTRGFWAIFHPLINKINSNMSFLKVTNYTKAVREGLYAEHENQLNNFKNKVKLFVMGTDKIPFADEDSFEAYIELVSLFAKDDLIFDKIYKKLSDSLNAELLSEDPNPSHLAEITGQMFMALDDLCKKPLKRYLYGGFTSETFMAWAETALDSNLPLWNWVLPKEKLFSEILSGIPPNKSIADNIKCAFQYVFKSGSSDHLIPFSESFNTYIQATNNQPNFDPDVMEFTCMLAFRSGVNMEETITTVSVYNSVGRISENQNIIPFVSLLLAKYKDDEFNVAGLQPHEKQIFQQVKTYWDESDEARSSWLLEKAKAYNAWDFIWKLLEKNKAVAKGVIDLALEEESLSKFLFDRKGNGLNDFWHYSEMLDNLESADGKTLIKKFVERQLQYGSLQEELEDSELNVVSYAPELRHLLDLCNDLALKNIERLLKELPEDEWEKALSSSDEENIDIVVLALVVKKRDASFHLSRKFMNALLECIKKESIFADFQEQLPDLVHLLSKQLLGGTFPTRMTALFIEHKGEILNQYWEALSPYFKANEIFTEDNSTLVADFIESAVESGDKRKLQWIINISNEIGLSNLYDKTESMITLFKEAISNAEKDDLKKILVKLGEVLKLDLSNSLIEMEKNEN